MPSVTEILTAYNDDEDGSEDFKRSKIGFVVIIGALILATIIYLFLKRKKNKK